VIHDYYQSLKQSEAVIPDNFYQSIFGRSSIVKTIPANTQLQMIHGIDKTIILPNQSTVNIEEKIRYKDYSDFLIEITSNVELNTPGWIEKESLADYLVYFIQPTKTVYVMKFKDIQAEWRKHKLLWSMLFPTHTTYSRTSYGNIYTVKNIAIPFHALTSIPILKLQL